MRNSVNDRSFNTLIYLITVVGSSSRVLFTNSRVRGVRKQQQHSRETLIRTFTRKIRHDYHGRYGMPDR